MNCDSCVLTLSILLATIWPTGLWVIAATSSGIYILSCQVPVLQCVLIIPQLGCNGVCMDKWNGWLFSKCEIMWDNWGAWFVWERHWSTKDQSPCLQIQKHSAFSDLAKRFKVIQKTILSSRLCGLFGTFAVCCIERLPPSTFQCWNDESLIIIHTHFLICEDLLGQERPISYLDFVVLYRWVLKWKTHTIFILFP